MEKHIFQTEAGEAWLWADAQSRRDGRPVALFINGAFSIERPRSFDLPGLLPEAAVFNAHLPGNHCPRAPTHSVEAYAALYSAVLDQLGRPAIVIGASVGALTALAMRSAWMRGVVLLEPPLQTEGLWPLQAGFRRMLADRPDDADLRAFLWGIFGLSETAQENRDYRSSLSGLDLPGWAAFGGEPLSPERPVQLIPSLVAEADRALAQAHPRLRVEVIPGVGHNVPGHAIAHVVRYVRDLMRRGGEESVRLASGPGAV